jgi:hypothetical protein
MKNIQFVTDSPAMEMPIFAVTDEEFALLFPAEGQDVEFNADVVRRLGPDRARTVFTAIAAREVPYPEVDGIHGTVFWDRERSRRYFPTRKAAEVIVRSISDDEYERLYGVRP